MKEVDIEAEKNILRELHVKMLVDHKTDVEEEMKYFTEDSILIPPNSPPIGVKAIREAVNEMVKTRWNLGTPGRGVKTLEVSASGDLAYDIGRFHMVNMRPEGPVEEQGYFVILYKKMDGDWKFMCQIWNNVET